MKKRVRNLMAILLVFALAVSGNGAVFAENVWSGPEVTALEGEAEILKDTGVTKFGDYTVKGDTMEYGCPYIPTKRHTVYKGESFFLVYDSHGNEVDDCYFRVKTVKWNGKAYYDDYEKNMDIYQAFYDGLKPGDKVDLTVTLTIRTAPTTGVQSSEQSIDGEIKGVTIVKRKMPIYRKIRCDRKDNLDRLWNVCDWDSYGEVYFKLTDSGKNKVGDRSGDEYKLKYKEDFDLYALGFRKEEEDITDCFEFDLSEGEEITLEVEDLYYLKSDIKEIQSGKTPEQFRETLRKHISLYKYSEKQEWDPSSLKFDGYYAKPVSKLENWEEFINDDEELSEFLARENVRIEGECRTEVKNFKGQPEDITLDYSIGIFKNAYNIYFDDFEEPADETGASYDRTREDLIKNTYAIKNETEKIRTGSFGSKEKFNLMVFDDDENDLDEKETAELFSKFRPGDTYKYLEVYWDIPDDTRPGGYANLFNDSLTLRFVKGDPLSGNDAEDDQEKKPGKDPAKDPSNPNSDIHKTDGSDVEGLSSDSAPYTFDEEKSVTLVGAVKVNITKKFEKYVSGNDYVESAKHRYKVDKKKWAKIDKKGNITPKKSGTIKVYFEQKEKGKPWTQIGEPVELYIQVPMLEKQKQVTMGDKLNARSFITKTTYAPTTWKSSKPMVADVDPITGEITIKNKGNAVIIAVYGEGNNTSKKKYKTKLKVKAS